MIGLCYPNCLLMVTSKSLFRLGLLSTVLCLGSVPAVRAQTSAFSFPKVEQGAESAGGTDGFEFRPTRDITVVSLGYYDHGRPGLELAHRVTLYELASRRRIAYATIDNRGQTVGRFRYRSIRPQRLKAGVSYLIAGFHPGSTRDPAASQPPGLSFAPAIGYRGYQFSYGSTPVFPVEPSDQPFFGPGFQFR